MARRKKLYFDFDFDTTDSGFDWGLARCTEGFPAEVLEVQNDTLAQKPAERYGGFLDALPALTVGSNPEIKRRNAVSAWWEFRKMDGFSASNGSGVDIKIFFLQPGSLTGSPDTESFIIPTEGTVLQGSDAVLRTEVAVGIFFGHPSLVGRIQGTLYVQRQHSIEV